MSWQAQLIHKMEELMAKIDDLVTKVAELTTVQQSAIALIEGLSAKVKAAGKDPAELDAVLKQLDDAKAQLAAALVANTEAETAPATAPATAAPTSAPPTS